MIPSNVILVPCYNTIISYYYLLSIVIRTSSAMDTHDNYLETIEGETETEHLYYMKQALAMVSMGLPLLNQ